MKTAKITASKQTRTFEGKKGGTYYVHAIALDNGDKGEVNTKTSDAPFLDVGATLNYTIEPNGTFPDKITRVTEDKGFAGKGGGYQKEPFEERCVSYAYSYSKDYLHGKDATKEQWVGLANYICDAMIATYKRVKP